MKKRFIMMFLLLIGLLYFPSVVSAENVIKVNNVSYEDVTTAISNARSGDVITLLKNTSASNITLVSGITLDIPQGIVLNLSGKNVINAGAIVKNNGNIIVNNGVLDISKLSYDNNGLVPNQSGTVSIKKTGRVIMLDVWAAKTTTLPDGWKPSLDSHILTNCENGGSIVIGEKTFVYNNNWVGAVAVINNNTVYYETLKEAITAATNNSTVKLLSNITIPKNSQSIDKSLTLDLNGFTLSAINRVLTVVRGTFNVIGKGIIEETIPDYGAIIVKGSNNVNDKNYTNITISKDVTLIGWSPIFITPYLSSNAPYGYGINITVNGTLKSLNDTGNTSGAGIYMNGQIQDKVNCPNITLSDTTVITSTGTGIYAAGYANWIINKASITGIESGVALKSGKLAFTNTKIIATGNDTSPTLGWSNGINASGAAIQIESNNSYAGDIDLTINGGSYTSEKGIVLYEYLDSKTNTTKVNSIKINNGEFSSATNKNIVLISDSMFNKIKGFVYGGTFSKSVSTYVANGYKITYNSSLSKYEVNKAIISSGKNSVSGTITNGDKAIVSLIQGGTTIRTVLADENGKFIISDVANGIYNILAKRNNDTIVKLIEVKNANIIINLNIQVGLTKNIEIIGKDTPSIMVDGLDLINHDLIFNIEKLNEDKSSVSQNEIKEVITTKNSMYLNLTPVNETAINELDKVLDIIIPLDLTKNNNIKVYRYHNNIVDVFKNEINKPTTLVDKTYYIDKTNNCIHIYANKFSTYAIGYDIIPNETITNPNTSDNIGLYIIIGLVGLSGIGFMIQRKKKIIYK